MKPRVNRAMRLLPLIVVAAGLIVWLLLPGKEEQKRFVPNAGPGYATPTMATSDVSTLISDSGYTRYHLVAALWQVFEDAEEPYWRFPDGISLERFDENMKVETTVEADSAVYFSRLRLWRLDGNVVMVNTSADSFLTQQLFWDQTDRKIYGDSFIHIVRTDRTIEGYGFESDQSMQYYTVNRPTAILPADMRPGARKNDSTATDSAPAPRPRAARASSEASTTATLAATSTPATESPAPAPSATTITPAPKSALQAQPGNTKLDGDTAKPQRRPSAAFRRAKRFN